MKLLKNLLPVFVMSFVLCFMLLIYEPVTMYANNMIDFWFDVHLMMFPLIKWFLIVFIAISILFAIVYLISNKLFKNNILYKISVLVFFVLFIITYIQGNFLANHLPDLDGSVINWAAYKSQDIISIVMVAIITIITIISTIKLKIDNMVNYTKYITIAVFIMLLTSFIPTLTTPKLFNNNLQLITTKKDINTTSTDKNFYILLLDSVDSVMFDEEMMNDSDFKNTFNDFTYYKNAQSVYAFTRDSIPQILSGIPNKNEKDFFEYYNDAMNQSKLINELSKQDYMINIYDEDIKWKNDKINNFVYDNKINDFQFVKEQIRYDLFKYLIFSLKKYSKIQNLNFNKAKVTNDVFSWDNFENYDSFKNDKLNKIEKKYFNFQHLAGSHQPSNMDKNMNKLENGTYQQSLQGSLTIIDTYINRLKDAGVYDNSVIIILADHGFTLENTILGRQNPILFIKGINEHHDMIKSNKKVSFTDLNEAYEKLLAGKTSDKVFDNIDDKKDRLFLFYEYTKEDNMIEYIQKGDAWDEKTLVKTGKEYNR